MEPQSGIKTWQWVVTVIVIIVLIIIGVLVFGGKSSEAPITGEEETATSTTETTLAQNRIVMTDQYPGNVVYLSSVQFSAPGWVVIQADDAGKPGKVIGSTYFEAGINPGKVTLTQAMVDGATYYAVMYSDNGDKKFDATKDVALKDARGSVIMRVFRSSTTVDTDIKG